MIFLINQLPRPLYRFYFSSSLLLVSSFMVPKILGFLFNICPSFPSSVTLPCFLFQVFYSCFPIVDFLFMDSCPWFPFPWSSVSFTWSSVFYTQFPILSFLSLVSYPGFPILSFLSMVSYSWFPILYFLSLVSYPWFPIFSFLSLVSYPWFPILVSYSQFPILGFLSLVSYLWFPILVSFSSLPISGFLSAWFPTCIVVFSLKDNLSFYSSNKESCICSGIRIHF